ncbi:lysocardiolipin acyltransferase 1 [Aplysia californica]|uniref:Lysocardiolipin acyltransferase 1 n=1 Tax=Aplysia californica TaxID=6500 RepID=A0ABM0JNL8_APLCA|nr:lysocardiolipin acyltransferase 1 [Aplysia californica]
MEFRNPFGGILLALMLFLTSTVGTIVMVTPALPVIFLSPQLSRRIMDFLIKLWFLLAVALYELLMGMKIVIKGKPARRGNSALILSNHRTRLDWLFLMSYLCRFNSIEEYRISLKAPLKKFPGAGWAMQCAGFLFLQRKWDLDKDHIANGINYFSKVKSKPQFLLFPEGTDMCHKAIARSHKFAEDKGYPKYDYVLHPKTTGFIHFVKEMKKGQILDSILDVTVAYPKTLIQSELQTLKGEFPEEVHFYVEDYPLETIPETDEELEKWCRELWSKKEERLRRFYESKSFENEPGDNEEEKNASPLSEEAVRSKLYSVVAFWVIFLLVTFIALFLYPYFRLFCLIGCATYVIIGFRHGGVDNVIYTAVKHYE